MSLSKNDKIIDITTVIHLNADEFNLFYFTGLRIFKIFSCSKRLFFAGALGKESRIYEYMIEDKDDLSALSIWQKFLLCSSIILSPTHENDRHKFSLSWINYDKYLKEGIHRYETKLLTFDNNSYEEENWLADCLYCTPPAEAADDPNTIKRNLLVTRAYNDKHSLYVLQEEQRVIRFKDYVEKVPILMNYRVPFTNDPEHI